jgi:hypothetical protein
MYYGKVGGCADLLVGRRFCGLGKNQVTPRDFSDFIQPPPSWATGRDSYCS